MLGPHTGILWGWFNSILIDVIFILPKEFLARSVSWWQIPSIFIDLRKFLFFLYLHNNLAGYRILSCEFFVEHFRFVLLIAWFLRSHSHPLQAVSLPSPVAPRMSPLCPFSAVCMHYVLAVELLLVLWPTHALLTPCICSSKTGTVSASLPQMSLPFPFPLLSHVLRAPSLGLL